MSLMLLMLVVHQVAQGVHGLLRLPLVMGLWAIGILPLRVLQVVVLDLVMVALLQQLQVNPLVELLDMGIKDMDMVGMEGMVEVIVLMGI